MVTQMQKRKLRNSGLEMSAFGLGCIDIGMSFSGHDETSSLRRISERLMSNLRLMISIK
jgi:aryl-alcohol dehydrogenase-like predicted oxidoreductase